MVKKIEFLSSEVAINFEKKTDFVFLDSYLWYQIRSGFIFQGSVGSQSRLTRVVKERSFFYRTFRF